ncbi:ABC-2 family transporter protein [Arenibacter nanhaiticus]|uniref:ABC-2 family transporter protein n=1 Tax=Arenibacter nanhaiticus TaxID=558155 RepID=A0A1M6F0A7_9FLAO|nr:M1 family aminopeptidase [Arenibacter nanhaiticus]SHI91076.1 ABC-2 family transporter protein [Arenibacter nanhaiticus]
MKTVLLNDIHTSLKQTTTTFSLLVYLVLGFFTGYKFNINVGDGITANAPYSIGFMTGLLSLIIILIATLLAFSTLFKEEDTDFGLIIFTTPIEKSQFALARFLSFYFLTVVSFFVLILGYILGLYVQYYAEMHSNFDLWHFVYPFIVFGMINSLVICSILFFSAKKFQNKLFVTIVGVMLYIMYMIVLIFSNAPFMAQSLPQSLLAQKISALTDIFGLSAYFYEAKDLDVFQRNNSIVSFANFLLLNRLLVILLSLIMVIWGIRSFSFLPVFKQKSKKDKTLLEAKILDTPFTTASTLFNSKTKQKALFSFVKIDLIYLFKSIPLITVSILLLFYVGVEMYGDIDMGIRLPQQYASSGLLAQTINGTFYFIGALVVIYFSNDVFWRSHATKFAIIQDTTYYARERLLGHSISMLVLILFLTGLMLLEAIIFQLIYKYLYFDWKAYIGVFVFNTLPLILLSFTLLFCNSKSRNKQVALGLSILLFLIFVAPISKYIISNPLFRFLSGYGGTYSDYIAYGSYLKMFLWRLIFGFSLIGLLILISHLIKTTGKRNNKIAPIIICGSIALVSSYHFLEGYLPKDKESAILEKVTYEKNYRKYQGHPQPTIKTVKTQIDLFPKEQAYVIKGKYWLVNTHNQAIDSFLLTIPKEFEIKSLVFFNKNEVLKLDRSISELNLGQSLQPQDSAKLEFELAYKWHPVNGHNSLNTIVENGSFMRISRYFPQFGYDASNEISDKNIRKKYALGEETKIKSLGAPKTDTDDFIRLDMQISTVKNQIVVGTGELKKQWQDVNRNYYQYQAIAIPFRFAVSSASYKVQKVQHNGISIEVLYHPLHANNVNQLIENTKLSLDYCTENFGPYPYSSVKFAEISSFTQGFNGTAYPGVIFMTENMTFNAKIEGSQNEDVINELAGHEVAHFWWGTNQIDPDYREGYAMLTESLAMYTEMMIYKKKYSKDKMLERVAIHQQIYDAAKGFNEDHSLLKATKNNAFVSYSKGAIVFVELSELIGEERLNFALKSFLIKHKYPNAKPTSTDLLKEILKVSDTKFEQKIKTMFE